VANPFTTYKKNLRAFVPLRQIKNPSQLPKKNLRAFAPSWQIKKTFPHYPLVIKQLKKTSKKTQQNPCEIK